MYKTLNLSPHDQRGLKLHEIQTGACLNTKASSSIPHHLRPSSNFQHQMVWHPHIIAESQGLAMPSRHRHRRKMPGSSSTEPSNGLRTSIDSQRDVDAELGHASLAQPFLNGDSRSTHDHDHDHDHDTSLLTTSETKSLNRSLAQRRRSFPSLTTLNNLC